jgi:hypothetical protein
MTYFIKGEHKKQYERFLSEANVGEREYTNQTVLYLLSSIPNVANNMEQFFDLNGKYIKPDETDNMDLSTGEWIIVGLAFNLFNGYVIDKDILSPHYVLSWLDSDLKKVYVEALSMNMGLAS